MVIRIVSAGEGRGTLSDGKVEGYVCGEKLPLRPYKRYYGIISNGGIFLRVLTLFPI